MYVFEICEFVGDVYDFLVGGVGMGALVVKSGFVFEVVDLCSDSFEFQLRLAIFALGNDCFDVSIFFVGGDFERIDPNGGLSSGVVFEHGK